MKCIYRNKIEPKIVRHFEWGNDNHGIECIQIGSEIRGSFEFGSFYDFAISISNSFKNIIMGPCNKHN